MAQFDLLLTQNVHATGIEFSEKYINIPKGGLLTADAAKTPTVIAPGTDGYYLVTDSAQAAGIKWAALPSLGQLHTQNTDTGTTSTTFELDNDGFKIELTAESASKFGVKVDGGASYADFQAKDATFNKITLANAPSAGTDATNKSYVDTLLAGLNGALLFKGNIKTTGGDITPTAFNALATYNIGWQYRAAEAGTYQGVACEIGDMLTAIVARSGSGAVPADWTVSQANIDGAVTGPVSAAADSIAVYNGTTGKIIKDGGTTIAAITALISTAQTAANNAIPKATLTAADQVVIGSAASTPAALQVNASTLVGRKATGTIAALTAAEVLTILGIAGNVVATGAEIDAGTDNVKYASPLAIANSSIVKGPGTITADTIAAFNGTTGKLLKSTSIAISAMARWVTAPAAKNSTGNAGEIATDGNFFYHYHVASTSWKRSPVATNW